MCVKFPPRDLNPDPYSSHPCGVSTSPKVHGGKTLSNLKIEKQKGKKKNIFILFLLRIILNHFIVTNK